MSADVQPSGLAGTWYAADPGALRADVEGLLGTERAPLPDLAGMIVPHAGYRYSGRAAGTAFARVERGRWRRAVVIAPSHRMGFGGAALFPGDGMATPLGVVRVDREATRALAATAGFIASRRPYAGEHSIEIELPFLQVVDPDLLVVPVLVGAADDPGVRAAIAAGLRGLEDGRTLFVVSSDFTHYGAAFDYLPFPPDDDAVVAARLRDLDFGAIGAIVAGDAGAFVDFVERTGITVCGRAPIAVFLALAARRFRAELVTYFTSLDVTGDREHSVSYAAILFRTAPEVQA